MNIKSILYINLVFLLSTPILGISTPDFIQKLWKKIDQEAINQEYDIGPDLITLENVKGNIKVKTWPQDKLVILATKSGDTGELQDTEVSINEKDNQIDIKTIQANDKPCATVNYIISIPEKSMLKVHVQQKGNIEVKKNTTGALDLYTKNGSIEVSETANNVIAKTGNGQIKIKQKNLGQSNSIFAETQKGNIYANLPKNTNANIHARTESGVIRSEQEITFSPVTTKLTKASWELLKKEVRGAIGTGGAPITLETSKGNIILTEY